MRQNFNLGNNSQGYFFITPLAMDQSYDAMAINDSDDEDLQQYADLNRVVYQDDSATDAGLDSGQNAFVVMVKSRYTLPAPTEYYTDDSDTITAAKDYTNTASLSVADSATGFYLDDKYDDGDESINHDHDLVVAKTDGDLIVKSFINTDIDDLSGHGSDDFVYQGAVNGVTWLSRSAGRTESLTVDWYGKGESGREIGENLSDDGTMVTLTANSDFFSGNNSNNFLVKSNRGLFAPGDKVMLLRERVIEGEDDDGQSISQTHITSYRFALPDTAPAACHYSYCGKGRDEASCWCKQAVDLTLDTVEVFPDQGYVNVLWRGNWQSNAIELANYREIRLTHLSEES